VRGRLHKLQAEARVLADPAIKAKADAAGLYPVTTTPAELAAFMGREAEHWSQVVKESGIRYD
jgi:tripartite-type tricarboxylate transporter receptor subunit TctC